MTIRKKKPSIAIYLVLSSLIFLVGMGCGDKESLDGDSTIEQETDSDQTPINWTCQIEAGADAPDYVNAIGCASDFDIVASRPVDAMLPGARSVKTVIDRITDHTLYFQNCNKYMLHYDFASEHLSGNGGPIIVDQNEFNENYTTVQRRFLLGAVTYYEDPDKWVYEIASNDNASPEMIETAFKLITKSAYFGDDLYFHPSGQAPEAAAEQLPDTVNVITTRELYDGINYQPLNLAKTCGRLVFLTDEELQTEYVGYRDIVVLDSVPNDISVVQGIITSTFQTPLSHVNVLSRNRGTPNMGLKGAFENETLRALEEKWVILDVGAFEYTIEETTKEIADGCWNQPEPLGVPNLDLSVTDLRDIETLVDMESDVPLADQVSAAIPAFGGKASHYGALSHVVEANTPKAFAIPIYYYDLFMKENQFDVRVDAFLADAEFEDSPEVRDQVLAQLREDMLAGTINEDFLAELKEKLNTEYPNTIMRFRSSTNAEDLGDFTGAGLYTSQSGDPNDPDKTVEDALRTVWSSIWFFRAFEERAYRGIDHRQVGMAILVHHSFPDEEANGVAITANPFDSTGTMPGFYVNVQHGDWSVVLPLSGISSDQFIYQFELQGQPIEFIAHSNLISPGTTVLTNAQTHELGIALKAIHQFFYPAYGPPLGSNEWYAMDVEFKFDAPPGEIPLLAVKQARPYPSPHPSSEE